MINNRQAGRRRGRGNNNGGGNPRQGGGQGRDNGNRIDSRARGNAAQLHEKYKNLARDAQMSGDRVNIEYYLQFADHYFRVLSEQRSRFEDQPRRQQSNDAFDDGYDGDGDDEYGAEGEPIRSGEQSGGVRYDRAEGQGSQRPDRPQRQDGQRSDAQRPDRGDGGLEREQGERRPSVGREQRFDRRPREVDPARDDTQPVPTFDEATPPVQVAQNEAPVQDAPRRRGRPRREPAVPNADASATFEADRLPPSLGSTPMASNDTGEASPKPRRRRTPRSDGGEVTAAE